MARARKRSGDIPVVVSVGEPSGDRIAAPVVEALRRARGDLSFFGTGGRALAAAGVETRHDIGDLAVTGLTEAVSRVRTAARVYADVWMQVRMRRPYLALLVDYPGLNLRLAGMLRRAGVPVLYYVAPQRWAWLGSRAAGIALRVNRLAVTLPFEVDFFAEHGVEATFVGHPALDLFHATPRAEARAQLGVGDGFPLLALLPGSREAEIKQHLEPMRAAARLLGERGPLGLVLATMPGAHEQLCASLAPEIPRAPSDVVLGAADAAVCASGTATLEAALAGVPSVVVYRLSRVSAALARRLVKVPHVALPNLVLDERVFPELLQEQVTGAGIAAALAPLLDASHATAVRDKLVGLRQRLGEPGVAERVAELGVELLPARS